MYKFEKIAICGKSLHLIELKIYILCTLYIKPYEFRSKLMKSTNGRRYGLPFPLFSYIFTLWRPQSKIFVVKMIREKTTLTFVFLVFVF